MRITPLQINNPQSAAKYLHTIGAEKYGIKIMAPKTIFRVFKVEGIDSYAANIIKQHFLSLGSDAALSRDALVKKIKTDIIIFGTLSQIRKFIQKVKHQPFGLRALAEQLHLRLKNEERTFHCLVRDKHLVIKKPIICGVINLTPDSFSNDGLLGRHGNSYDTPKELILAKVTEMVKSGAKIIDIGGESTRPFSRPISEEEEIRRVIPYLKVIRKHFPRIILSVDTYKYRVAKAAIEEGVDIINDITALRHSPQIVSLIKKYRIGCILMHMKGTPRSMQRSPHYKNVIQEVLQFLEKRINFCLTQGIEQRQLFVDPGVGFGKRLEDNLRILNHLYAFKSLELPIFLGVSRKSFIGTIAGAKVEERLPGTVASIIIATFNGADIVRVHDVREIAQAMKISDRIVHN